MSDVAELSLGRTCLVRPFAGLRFGIVETGKEVIGHGPSKGAC